MEILIFLAALIGLAVAAPVYGADSRPTEAERRRP